MLNDDFDINAILHIIQDFYNTKKTVPFILTLLPIIKQSIFPWGEDSLLRIVTKIGFAWRECKSKRKLVERPGNIYLQ